MTVRHGRRYVRIFSPMSLLAVGAVALCAGLAALFVAKLLPEDLLSREFQTVAFWLGIYFLVRDQLAVDWGVVWAAGLVALGVVVVVASVRPRR